MTLCSQKRQKTRADSADSTEKEINFELSFNVVGYFLSNLNIYSMYAVNIWLRNSNNQQTCEKQMDAKVEWFRFDCTSNLKHCKWNEGIAYVDNVSYDFFPTFFYLHVWIDVLVLSIKGPHEPTNLVRKISRDQRSVCKFLHSVRLCLCFFLSPSLRTGYLEAVGLTLTR